MAIEKSGSPSACGARAKAGGCVGCVHLTRNKVLGRVSM
jgi:hypothetical protein